MNRILSLAVPLAVYIAAAAPAFACGIEGSVRWGDGSKSNKTTTISTSWNSATAFPSGGHYSLDLGKSACGASITVYLDGNQGQRVTVPSSGNARVDFTAK